MKEDSVERLSEFDLATSSRLGESERPPSFSPLAVSQAENLYIPIPPVGLPWEFGRAVTRRASAVSLHCIGAGYILLQRVSRLGLRGHSRRFLDSA